MSVFEELDPEKLDYYWDIYVAEVVAKYGLQRGVRAKKGGEVAHTDSTEYNRALERENRRIQMENASLRERLAKSEEILKDPAKLRSRANTIEFKQKVSASLKARYGKKGSLRIIGKVKGTDATVLTCTAGTFRYIVVTRPDGEAFLYNYAPKLGVAGMDKVANLAVHRE